MSSYYYTTVDVPTYNISVGYQVLGVTYTGEAVLILPEIRLVGGISFTITDEGGNASVNNIKIRSSGTDTICGNTEIVINNNFGSVTLYTNTVDCWFLSSKI